MSQEKISKVDVFKCEWEACNISFKDENKCITERFAIIVKDSDPIRVIALISPADNVTVSDIMNAEFIVKAHNAALAIAPNNPMIVVEKLPSIIASYKDCVAELKCYDLSKETVPVLNNAKELLKELNGASTIEREPILTDRDTFYSASEEILFYVANSTKELSLIQCVSMFKNIQTFFDQVHGGKTDVRTASINRSSRFKGKDVFWVQGISRYRIPEYTMILSDEWTMWKWLEN